MAKYTIHFQHITPNIPRGNMQALKTMTQIFDEISKINNTSINDILGESCSISAESTGILITLPDKISMAKLLGLLISHPQYDAETSVTSTTSKEAVYWFKNFTNNEEEETFFVLYNPQQVSKSICNPLL
jgi:hypothetical protein